MKLYKITAPDTRMHSRQIAWAGSSAGAIKVRKAIFEHRQNMGDRTIKRNSITIEATEVASGKAGLIDFLNVTTFTEFELEVEDDTTAQAA